MRRKKSGDSDGGGNWMDTYGDMVTLLLTFFVMLFSMSTMDKAKWEKLAQALSGDSDPTTVVEIQDDSTVNVDQDSSSSDADVTNDAADIKEVTEFNELYEYLLQYVEDNNLTESVKLYEGNGYTFITFQNNIFFDGNSSTLRSDGKKILDYFAKGIKGIPDQIEELRIYGHTAQVGLKPDSGVQAITFDRQLSVDRAINVLLYMQFKNVIAPKKLVAVGYGQYYPIVTPDGTEASRTQNRRVEIYIIEKDAEVLSLDEVYSQVTSGTPNDGSQNETQESE